MIGNLEIQTLTCRMGNSCFALWFTSIIIGFKCCFPPPSYTRRPLLLAIFWLDAMFVRGFIVALSPPPSFHEAFAG